MKYTKRLTQKMEEYEIIIETPEGKEKYALQTDENLDQTIFDYQNDQSVYNPINDRNIERRELLVKIAGELQKETATKWAYR